MKVAIVGAGISGLAAARTLHSLGNEAVVFEKSNALAGRVATRRVGPYTFDTGATSIAPRGRALETALKTQLSTDHLVEIPKPIWTMAYGRILPGDAAKMKIQRYTFSPGIAHLGKLLAEGLEVRRNCLIEALEPHGAGWTVAGEPFDSVIIAIPAPQAAELLKPLGQEWRVTPVRYRACLSVLLGYETSFDAPYHALVDTEQRQPVIWVSAESIKSPDRAPEGHSCFVAQMGASFSAAHYEDSDFEIIREATTMMKRLFGEQFSNPAVAQVKRWKYSQPEITTSFESANRGASTLWVSGDSVTGPRIEQAFDAGVLAAQSLLQINPS